MSNLTIASDGLPALPIKPHTRDKLSWIKRCIDQFTTAMSPDADHRHPRFRGFAERNYIDMLCGPGLVVTTDTREEEKGSPIIALSTRYPFSHYYFVDSDPMNITALRQRVERDGYAAESSKSYLAGDCNARVHDVLRYIDKTRSINLAVIDGFGVECRWSTIEALAVCRRMDLIILIPQGMSINRNLHKWIGHTDPTALDGFFGTTDWRGIYQDAYSQPSKCIRSFLDLYQSNLRKLGYAQTDQVHEQLVKSEGGQKLYYLVFASRSELGHRFWKQATDKDAAGQRRLFE
jgi:three-Cys-motif partner protein